MKLKQQKIEKVINVHELPSGVQIEQLVEDGKTKSVIFRMFKKLRPVLVKTTDFNYHFTQLFYSDSEHNVMVDNIMEFCKDKTDEEIEAYIVLLDYSGHMVFNLKMEPIPTVYHFDYIGCFKEKEKKDKNYAEIIELLKKHPFTISLTDKAIEHYNSNFFYQRGIKLWRVKPSIEVYRKLWNKILEGKGDYPSVRLSDALKCTHSFNFVDNVYDIPMELLQNYWNTKEAYEEDSNKD